jgi:iron complex outermembrane receptor protein
MTKICARSTTVRKLLSSPGAVAGTLVATSLMAAHSSGFAQESSSPEAATELSEVVVTATRQAVGSQKVAISLTAISASDLATSGVTNAGQLAQLAPNLNVLTTVSVGSPRFSMRGISNQDVFPTGSSAVATYIDDVYQASLFGVTSAIFDLQRIEVLRGPQGTTFGKNTTGGAVAYFSQQPTNRFEGYTTVRVAGGDRPERFVEGAVNLPLVDNQLAMRLSFHIDNHSGYVRDLANGRERGGGNSQSERLQLRWTPTADTAVNLTVYDSRIRNDTALWRADILPDNGFFLPPQPLQIDEVNFNAHDLHDNADNYGATLRIEQALGQFSLTAISHYRRDPVDQAQDTDGIPFDILNYRAISVGQQFGQEIRLASDPNQRLSGLLGLYAERDTVDDTELESATLTDSAILGKYNDPARYITRTKTYAAFTTLTFKMTDQVSVTGGVRKSSETKSQDATKSYYQTSFYDWTDSNINFTGPPPVTPDEVLSYKLSQKALPLSWDGTINYTPGSDVLLFTRVAKGFRSGGFNLAAQAYPSPFGFQPVAIPPPFAGESVKSYEVGLKSTWLNRTLRLNASAFHYDYGNQQVTTYPGGVVVTANAASSKVDGGEIEITASPVARLELSGSAGYANARYTRYVTEIGDFSGNRLLQAPAWTGNVSANYTVPLTAGYGLLANTSWSYRSAVFWDAANSAAFRAGGMTVGNFRLAIEPETGKGLSLAAFVNNVSNQRPLESGFQFGPGYNVKLFGVGRLFGADLAYKW